MAHLAREQRLRLSAVAMVLSGTMALLFAPGIRAQSNREASQARIRVIASVSPAGANLSKEQLSAFVDDRPAVVQDVVSASEQPLVFAIIIDISASLYDKQEQAFEKESSLELFRQLARAPNTGFFGDFNDELYLSHKPASVDSVLQEIKNIGQFRGGTALHDAVLDAAKLVSRAAKGTSSRRAVFVFTDGQENASNLNLKQVVPELQRQGVPIFCVGFLDPQVPNKAATLQSLSSSTGGIAVLLSEVREVIQMLVGETRYQYWLTVESESPNDGKLHSFAVRSHEINLRISVPSQIPAR